MVPPALPRKAFFSERDFASKIGNSTHASRVSMYGSPQQVSVTTSARGTARCPEARPPRCPGLPTPGGSAPWRICSSWARAAICWANSAVWMPWNSPSSQPTSCACAMRSSASDGIDVVGERQGEPLEFVAQFRRQALFEFADADVAWISRSRLRLASSSGAARTSSSSCLIIVPIRITLAGCSTRSVRDVSSSPSRPAAHDLGSDVADDLDVCRRFRAHGHWCPCVGSAPLVDAGFAVVVDLRPRLGLV